MSHEESFQIFEERPDHHYRTEIPNIVFELNLSPSEFKLYCFYKKVAGDKGECIMSQSNIEKRIGVSKDIQQEANQKLRRSFDLLGGKSLIRFYQTKKQDGGQGTNQILIVDIWRENGNHFRSDPLPEIPVPPTGNPGTPYRENRHKEEPKTKKNHINKVNDRATPSLTPSKEGSKSLDSRKRHANAHLAGLTQEQLDIFEWLKKQGINSHEDTLAWWARTYPLKRLEEVIKEAKSRKAKSLGAYMQKILKTGVSVVSGRIGKNAETATLFKEIRGWSDLEIHQKYATIKSIQVEIPFDIDYDEFQKQLHEKYECFGEKR